MGTTSSYWCHDIYHPIWNISDHSSHTTYRTIHNWTLCHHQTLGSDVVKFIRRHTKSAQDNPFGYFYLLANLHKTPTTTCPIYSNCASLPHAIGKWVDKQLQPINSTTATAFPHLSLGPLIKSLTIIMNNNRMNFGDIYARHHHGGHVASTIDCKSACCNLQEHLHHALSKSNSTLPQTFHQQLFWHLAPRPQPFHWSSKLRNVQNSHQRHGTHVGVQPRLKWGCLHGPHNHAHQWQDIKDINKIYTKPKVLHLYIPPFSCHAPGVPTRLIYGHFYQDDAVHLSTWHWPRTLQLLCGYTLTHLLPIF